MAPAPAAELEGYYKEASQATGVPWPVLAAVHLVETRMGRIRGESSAGAQGPMQFLPSTWAAYGQGDINSNHDAIMTAARYLQNFRDVTENFIARKHVTQVRVFKRVIDTLIIVITVSTALITASRTAV